MCSFDLFPLELMSKLGPGVAAQGYYFIQSPLSRRLALSTLQQII